MDSLTLAYIVTGVFLVLLFLGTPIAIAMALCGLAGMWILKSAAAGLVLFATVPYTNIANYGLAVIPLFMLMGQFALYSGIAEELYDTAYKWLGHLRGGLSMATIGACAAFGAVTGSSTATALTFGSVAMPQMRKYKYSPSLATATCASGGTLGILIPPSIPMILYGIITENSIGKLFIAGVLPGILLASLFMIAVYIITTLNPAAGPSGPGTSLREKILSFKTTWTVVVLFALVLGGIFAGWFTPTEAAAIGASGAFLIAIVRRKLTWQKFVTSLMDTSRLAAMALFIVFSAFIFSYFITQTGLPIVFSKFLAGLEVHRFIIMAGIIVLYIILGCMMDAIAMLVISIPFIYPIVINLGFDPIWYGIIMVVMCEMALITPPVGMNLFILSGVTGEDIVTIIRGVWPFIIAMVICIVLLLFFPQIATFLPGFMLY